MKPLFFLLFAACILFSCRSNKQPAAKDAILSKSVSHKDSVQMLAKRFSQFMDGFWVKKEYVEDLVKTKSPLASSYKADGITALNIDMQKVAGDSVIIGSGLSNHEGGILIVKLQTGQNARALKTTLATIDDKPGDFYEMGYKVK